MHSTINNTIKFFIVFVFAICTGCVSSTQPPQSSEDKVAAATKQLEIEQQRREKERQRQEEEKRVLEEQQDKLVKNKIDAIIKAKAINPNNLDYKLYFGDKFEYSKGEFESNSDYVKRLKTLVDTYKVYYFDIETKLSQYDLDKHRYNLLKPDVLIDIPYEFKSNPYGSVINPSLARSEYRKNRGEFISIPLKTKEDKSTYKGKNAYGVESVVQKRRTKTWELAAKFNRFDNTVGYGYDLLIIYGPKLYDMLALKIPVDEAKTLKIKDHRIVVRLGVKFSYGVGPIALGYMHDGQSPTINAPWDTMNSTEMLGVDLDSICIMRKDNHKVLSCRVKLDS